MLPSRRVRARAVMLLAALAAALLPATGAHAEGHQVSGGRLDWGVKASFQSYVTGPIAKGKWTLNGGAATAGDSDFRFHSAKGAYDADTGAFEARFTGGVRFTGHPKPDGSHELDLAIADPVVRISGGRGTLYADMTSKARGSGTVTSAARVPLAALDLTGVNMRGGGTAVRLDAVPTRLTAEGARAFAGYYAEGAALDPLNLSVDVTSGPARPEGTASPSPTAKRPGKPAEAPAKGRFENAAVDWGVRRTFREYVTGSVAQGSWRLSEGAQDGGTLFRFPAGHGTYDTDQDTLEGTFAGSLRFTGKDLDLTLSGVSVRVGRDGTGTLSADVRRAGAGADQDVPLVTFKAGELRPRDGLIAVTEAPAALTARGARAFGGMYAAGTGMDPVSLAVALDDSARLPALPDLGDAPSASAPPKPAAREAADGSSSSSSSAGPLVAALCAAGALAAAAAAVVALRRRRRAPETGDD
ncbi:HtaA domain-containing protein [Streptomyces sp. XD-27]|uniref:HtaA domain-containing protein n=1 Tax=Streptomyces sp. XD-27 TaxID=3062779 RepID=UPI0026F41194|nr:HtaA domain-containing protein [Streptomyces sp. XD-27]WKX74189.1 HtaA domain-containing protein [Streptomyces sp. XD-27]